MSHDQYENPLITRYASREMSRIWSAQHRHSTWRRLWVALAESESELGIRITPAQIEELRSVVDDIDFELAAKYEKQLRHDVMAHVHTYGDRCPSARGQHARRAARAAAPSPGELPGRGRWHHAGRRDPALARRRPALT